MTGQQCAYIALVSGIIGVFTIGFGVLIRDPYPCAGGTSALLFGVVLAILSLRDRP